MKKILRYALVLALALPFVCTNAQEATSKKGYVMYGVAFYNLENLFDTINTNGTYDLEFSPNGARQWNHQKYWQKQHNLAYAISQMATKATPNGPAIIGVSEIEIDTLEKFNEKLYVPFLQGSGVVYRGERIHSQQRRLIPTLLRQKASELTELEIEKSLNINGRYLFDMYVAKERFYEVYNLLYGDTDRYKMYNMTALAQHYLDLSPFIDFTKSLYVSLSFAIKGRESAEEDFVIYTVRDSSGKNSSSDIEQANEWLEDYNVNVINIILSNHIKKRNQIRKSFDIKSPGEFIEEIKSRDIASEFKRYEESALSLSPSAKLIDIPTNDLMKFQQGVFLLLDGFNLIDSRYLTKDIREDFEIKKYIVNKALIPELNKIIESEAPQYIYDRLLNISAAVR